MMRRTALKRPPFRRKPPRPNPAGHFPEHLARIRRLPCCVCASRRFVVPHHATYGRGLSRKSSDHETMPLCRRCHRDFHNAAGWFADWSREQRREWQRQMVQRYAPSKEVA